MSNKGNFSQAMREILGIDSSKDKGGNKAARIEENMVASEDRKENFDEEAANHFDQAGDRLNQDFSQAFNPTTTNENARAAHEAMAEAAAKAEAEAEAREMEDFVSGEETEDTASYEHVEAEEVDAKSYEAERESGPSMRDPFPGPQFGGDDMGGYDQSEVGTTIITRNTIVEGNIRSFENIELNGTVKGKIATTKNVGVSGNVVGDIQATDILLEGADIRGNVTSKGALLMDKDTLLVGDVEAQNTRVDGKLKGEVNIGGNGEFLSNSIMVGNVTVSNIYVQYGAKIQGYINTNFTKNEEDSIFGQITGN